MDPAFPRDPEVVGWLTTLGVGSRCQWDVLVFLVRHQSTLLGAADLARLLGYASQTMVVALDVLESLALVERSRVSQGARLYQCSGPLEGARGTAWTQLQALMTTRAGRVRIARQLRPDHTPNERADQAKHFLAEAQQRLQVHRREAREYAERKQRWLKAI
jgi:DNA-binding transcriptional ArsR family regulator